MGSSVLGGANRKYSNVGWGEQKIDDWQYLWTVGRYSSVQGGVNRKQMICNTCGQLADIQLQF